MSRDGRDGRNETAFVHQLLPVLCDTGRVLVWRKNSGVVVVHDRAVNLGAAGMPDIMGYEIGRGRPFVAFEIKSPTAALTAAQQMFLERVRRDSHVGLVYRYDDALDWDANLAAARDALLRALDAHRAATA